jgi:hypothetical protein
MKRSWGAALVAGCLLGVLPGIGGAAQAQQAQAQAQRRSVEPGLRVYVYGESSQMSGDCDPENPYRPRECTGDVVLTDPTSEKTFAVDLYGTPGGPDAHGVRVRVSFTAPQIAAAGFGSAKDFTERLTARFPDGAGVADLGWTVSADGSASLDLPATDVPSGTTVHRELYFFAAYSIREGTLAGTATATDDAGDTYTNGTSLTFYKRLTSTFLGRDADGVLHAHRVGCPFCGGVFVGGPYTRGTGWNAATAAVRLGEPRDSVQPGPYLLARTPDGLLRLHRPTASGDTQTTVGWGYNQYDAFAGAGDITGDGALDFLARDAGGRLFRYDGLPGTTGFASRVQVGRGWQTYDRLIGGGDLDNDGRPDLLARDRAGDLWYYRGTGVAAAPYAARQKIGWGWDTYDTILLVGPCDYSGNACLVARDGRGRLWGYVSTGTARPEVTGRVQVGWGYGVYTAMF